MLKLTIETAPGGPVSALLTMPAKPKACFVFAHGAGAGMTHAFMQQAAMGLHDRRIATLRYQFPYMEKGSRRPDTPAIAQATVRAAVAEAQRRCRGVPLIAGGKSFGGRMTSQAQAASPLQDVRGLAFVGFPLHPAGKPSTARADHLAAIDIPMLFIQGTRDKLAEWPLIEATVNGLAPRATLAEVPDADHAFHVPVRSGRTDVEAMDAFLDAFARWIIDLVS